MEGWQQEEMCEGGRRVGETMVVRMRGKRGGGGDEEKKKEEEKEEEKEVGKFR